jgi:hypothetical protein
LARHASFAHGRSRLGDVAALFADMNAVDDTRIGSGPDFDK